MLIPRLSTLLRTSLARPSCMRRWLARRGPSSPTSRRCGVISEPLRTTLTQKRHNVDPIGGVLCTFRLTPILHAHWPELLTDARTARSSRAAPGIKRWVEIPTGGGVTRKTLSSDLEIGSPDPRMASRALKKWPFPRIQPPAPASLRYTHHCRSRRRHAVTIGGKRRGPSLVVVACPQLGIAGGTAVPDAVRTLAMKTRAMWMRRSEAVPKRRDRQSLRGRRRSTHACSRHCSFHVPACFMDFGRGKKNRTQK